VLQGFDISPAGSSFAVRFTGAGSKFILLRDNLVHDGSAGAGISVDLGASDATIEGNEIWNFSRGGDIDSHGVVVQPTTARVRVLRNHIHGNNGDSVQCIGPEQVSTGGAPAVDVLIEGNYMHEDRENAVDIKTCTDVTIRGNRAHSYFKTTTANGEGIVIHNGATRVIVEGNDVSNANRGIVIGEQISDVMVRHNVFHDGNNERIGIYFYQGKTMQAYHNTLINLATGVKVGTATGVTVANNVFSGCGQSVTGSGAVDRNLFFQSPTAGTGAITGDPRLDAAFVPADGSPALDAAKPLPGEPAGCGAAPDLGAKERC
jgi:nitrous oxidase accessory protein NosD